MPIITTVTTVTGNTTLGATHTSVLADATVGAITITLPTAVGISGSLYMIKKIDSSANAVTVDANGSQTIDGILTEVLQRQWDKVSVQSNGANWLITL